MMGWLDGGNGEKMGLKIQFRGRTRRRYQGCTYIYFFWLKLPDGW